MDERTLRAASPTAQVRIICEEFLSDGNPHTRKQMEKHIKERLQLLGLPVPSSGCLSGGIRQAIHNKNCIKLGTALYQAPATSSELSAERRMDKAVDCLGSAINTLVALAHEIDYITASENEIDELNLLKDCIKDLIAWQDKLT
jgi:hypothetical protein